MGLKLGYSIRDTITTYYFQKVPLLTILPSSLVRYTEFLSCLDMGTKRVEVFSLVIVDQIRIYTGAFLSLT